MKLLVDVELGNDAMQTPADVNRALGYSLTRFSPDPSAVLREGDWAPVLDVNGNTVGWWEVVAP